MSKKHPHTTDEYVASVARMIRAAGRRVAQADPDQLAALHQLHEAIDEAMVVAIAGQRADGVWWSSMGEALGVSKQAVIQRWAGKVEALEAERATEVNYLECPGSGKPALPAKWKQGSETPKGSCPVCQARVMTNPNGTICGHQQHDRYGQPVHAPALLKGA